MSRLKPDERYKQLLDSAVEVAEQCGFNKMTHVLVALKAKVSKATVFNYFKTIDQLRDDVMQVAIERELLPVIAAGVVSRNIKALNTPVELKQKAMASIV